MAEIFFQIAFHFPDAVFFITHHLLIDMVLADQLIIGHQHAAIIIIGDEFFAAPARIVQSNRSGAPLKPPKLSDVVMPSLLVPGLS